MILLIINFLLIIDKLFYKLIVLNNIKIWLIIKNKLIINNSNFDWKLIKLLLKVILIKFVLLIWKIDR
jgi:hypothetical protein